MPTYHRSQRLRLVGTGPKVEQLQEGRFRLTFTCTATNPNEAWMNGNKDQIMTAYGTLQSAQKNIAGIDPRTDEAYSDMVLFRTEANPSERDLIITLVYETATETFVKSQDDRIDFELNGLQRVTRVTIAKTGTTLPSVTIGTTEITVDGTACKLASRSVEENDAFIQITETYLQSGITDVREDIVGSQKAIVITKVGNEPTASEAASKSDIAYDASDDWSVARKDVSQEGGLKIYNYTFLLDNTVLSQSQDKQSSLKTEVIEVFNPKVTIDGLTVEGGSFVAGNYFLTNVPSNGKNRYTQSQGDFYPKTIGYTGSVWQISQSTGIYGTSSDTNPDNPDDPPSTGWSGTGNNEITDITIREFDQTLPNSLSGFELSHRYDKEGYSLINIQKSNIDGIPTMRYTFAKDNVLISQSEEKVGSQLAIVKEAFNGTPSTPSGYSIADEQESNIGGIPTRRFRFLKDNVTLSTSEDKVGSQLAIVKEVFNGTPSTPSNYVLASEEESNVDGIPTRRYRFLKEDVQLSLSVDNQSPLKTEIQEWFSPEGDNNRDSKVGYSLINQQDSNVDGIPTVRYTFAKNNVLLSVSEDKIGSQNAIVNEIFNPTNESFTGKDTDGVNLSGYSEADRTESNHDGIKTIRVRFLQDNVLLSRSIDESRADKPEVIEYFKPSASRLEAYDAETNPGGIPDGKILDAKAESNVDGIPTERYTFRKDDAVLSQNWDKIGSQQAVVITKYNSDPTSSDVENFTGDSGLTYVIARKVKNGRERTFTFMETNALLSVSEDKIGSQNAIVNEVFKPSSESIPCKDVDGNTLTTHTEADRTESNHDGIKTVRVRFLKNNCILSTSEDLIGSQKAVIIEKFGSSAPATTDDDVNDIDLTDNYTIANKQESSVDGIKTFRYTFLQEDVVLSKSVDNESPLLTEVLEVFKPSSARDDKNGYVLTNKTESNVDGIPTERYTFKKTGVILSQSHELVGSQEAVVISKFGSVPTVGEANTFGGSGYTIAKKEESGTTNQKTFTYTFLQSNKVLSVSKDKIGSQEAVVNEIFNPTDEDADTDGLQITGKDENGVDLSGYSEADRRISDFEGIKTVRVRFLKNDVVLSRSRDSVGSQKAVVLEVFNGNNEANDANTYGAGAGYVLAKEEESNVDGIDTKRYTYLQPSILSRTDDKKDPACPITIVAFDKDENDSGIFGSTGTPEVSSSDYVLVSKTERDFEGIETFEMRFEKNEYFLSERENEFGRIENVKVEQGGSYELQDMPGNATTINGTASSYIIAQEITEGTVPRRTTTYSTAGIESVSEDLVGATKVITITKFITTPTTTDAKTYSNDSSDAAGDFVLINDTNNRVNGVDIFTYRFAIKNAIVSTSFDKVGSQKAFVVEKFGDTAPDTGETINGVDLSGYSIAKEDESNVDGIKTFRYTFLKSGVTLSTNLDLVGSQKAQVIEVFDGTPNTPDGYSQAKLDFSNVNGISTSRFTFLKPSIISVAQDFVEDINTIQVTAFSKTEAEVKTDLDEVTTNHKLISQRENNHDGIKTTTYTFEINTSDIIQFTADDRLQVTRTIYEVYNYDYDSNYTVGTSTDTVNGTLLTLTSLRVDQRGTAGSFTKLTAVYTQPKIVTVSPIMTSQYNAVPMYQYRSIVSSAKTINTSATISDPNGTNIQANAVFFEPSINNNTSPSTFTQNVLNTSTNLSVADSSVLISSHDDFYDFFYPGVVKITEKNIGRKNRVSIDVKKTSYPVTSKVRCKVYNFIQRGDDIIESDYTYDGSSGLWSPNTWGEINFRHEQDVFDDGTKVAVTAYNNSYNGYRVVGAPTIKKIQIFSNEFSQIYYNGQDLGFTGRKRLYSIDIPSYGPPDPVGKFWCLNVDISPAFRDTDGNQYYNKQIVVTDRVPNIIPNKLTYAN